MVWWLLTTWGEKLGAAKRVSAYRSDMKWMNPQYGKLYRYRISCDVKLPTGETITEELWTTADFSDLKNPIFYDGISSFAEMKRALTEQIRKRYPRQPEVGAVNS